MVLRQLQMGLVTVVIAGCSFQHGVAPSSGEIGVDAQHGAITAGFQRDVNGYTAVVDTSILLKSSNAAQGDANVVGWEQQSGEHAFALVRFDSIFGTGAGQIPEAAQIVAAELRYIVSDAGDPAEVHEVVIDWSESSTTYANFGLAAGAQPIADYRVEVVAMAAGTSGPQVVDVTSSLRSWSREPAANRGWIFVPLTDGGTRFASSEAAADRPLLAVTYVP